MVTEKPPRRSMAEKEPVTIDLTPDDAGVVAEPVRSNDSDSPENAPETPLESAQAPHAPVASEEPVVSEPVHEAEPLAAEQTAFEASPAFDEPAKKPDEAEPASVLQPTGRSTSTSTLVAAGIFGGIVALLLAGSMQYAGYLPSSSSSTSDSAALSEEIAALRQDIQTLRNQPASPDAELAGRVQALEGALAQNTGASTEESLTAIQQQLAETRAAAEARTAELSRRLEQAEAQINDRGPEQQVARAVAAAALKAAIDRGGSFEAELQAYTNIAGDDPSIADLKIFAAGGAPSRAELQSEFPAVADAIIEASASASSDPNQGIAGRLLSSAMSVVKVRRVGDVEGETADAIVARLEDRLRSGDLPAAAQQWDALPDAAKSVSADFKRKLDARVQVENLVGGTLSRALAGTKSGS